VLVLTQRFLTRRMKRMINPPLLGASVMLALFLGWITFAFLTENNQLGTARQEAFPVLHTLWQARATAFDARTDQSHYLIARGSGQRYEDSFKEKTKRLADGPVDGGITAAPRFKGYLADGLASPALSDEGRRSLTAATAAYGRYIQIDGHIRQLDKSGERPRAIALATGSGESAVAFAEFNVALDRTLSDAQGAFDSAIDKASWRIAYLEFITLAMAILTVVLAWIGISPRLAEYRI
ncbi:MAG TPA: hypothetical protein V6D17_02790, partial [Candidatus Obscuribacterales bacterium]